MLEVVLLLGLGEPAGEHGVDYQVLTLVLALGASVELVRGAQLAELHHPAVFGQFEAEEVLVIVGVRLEDATLGGWLRIVFLQRRGAGRTFATQE